MRKHAQTWSMDVIMGVALFLVGIILVYSFLGLRADSDQSDLVKEEGERLPQLLSTSLDENYSFIIENRVDKERLEAFVNFTYNETKRALGIANDFCIYFEDESGNIINITEGVVGVGSGKARVGGIECGKR